MDAIFVWTLKDAVSLVIVVLIAAVGLAVIIRDVIRHSLCKHDGGVNETQACDAICRKCGKNLGFIGLWRL